MRKIKFFLYTNETKITSIFDQCYGGIVEVIKTEGKQRGFKANLTTKLGNVLKWFSPIEPEVETEFENLSLTSEETRKKLEGKPELQLALSLISLEKNQLVYHMPQYIDKSEIRPNRFVLIESIFDLMLDNFSKSLIYKEDIPTNISQLLSKSDIDMICKKVEQEVKLEKGEPHLIISSIMKTYEGTNVLVLSTCNKKFISHFGHREIYVPQRSKKLFGRLLGWWTETILVVDPIAIWSEE